MIINAAIKMILKFLSGLQWATVIELGKDLIDLDESKDPNLKKSSKFSTVLDRIVSSGILGEGKSMNVIRGFIELLLYYTRRNPSHFEKK